MPLGFLHMGREMKYKSKPVVIEAVQYLPLLRMVYPGVKKDEEGRSYIETVSGVAFVHEGDWIITEPDGKNYYPCSDKVFQQKYEALHD